MAVMGGEWRLCYNVGGLGIFGALDGGKKRFEPNLVFFARFDGWFEPRGMSMAGA